VAIMMVTKTKNTAPVVMLSSRRRACSKIMVNGSNSATLIRSVDNVKKPLMVKDDDDSI